MKLHYAEYGNSGTALVILHGLMGSERNWTGAAKTLSGSLRVIVPDMRNHGVSPHSDLHTVSAMRQDILELISEIPYRQLFILGHSMGGYVAMDLAFHHPELLHGLIIEDIAPRSYDTELPQMLQAMAALDVSGIQSKSEIDQRLKNAVPREAVRKFLLTNLHRVNDHLAWRLNVPALLRFTSEDLKKDAFAPELKFEGPALFIGGGASPYLLTNEAHRIRLHFPSAEIRMIPGANHWVHYDAPAEFCRQVDTFIKHHLS